MLTGIRDVSHHDKDRGDTDVSGTPILIAKATQGASFNDPSYTYWLGKGKPTAAYHCVEPASHGNLDAQISHMLSVIGTSRQVMIDWEIWEDAPNVNVRHASISECKYVVQGFMAKGGNVKALYVPKWFWEGSLHEGSLSWFADQGLFNINSNYSVPPCAPSAMATFGGLPVKMHQYTSTPHDKNAFPGTVEELLQLWGFDVARTLTDDDLEAIFTYVGKGATVQPPNYSGAGQPIQLGKALSSIMNYNYEGCVHTREIKTDLADGVPVNLTDAQAETLATLIAAKIVLPPADSLSDDDLAKVKEQVKAALREGTAA